MTKPKSKTAVTTAPITSTLPIDETGVELLENLHPSTTADDTKQSTGDIYPTDITEPGTPDGSDLEEEPVIESAPVTTDTDTPVETTSLTSIQSTRPVAVSPLQAAAVLRLNAVPFAQRDTMLLAMSAMDLFAGSAPAEELSAEIGRLLESAAVPKQKAVADIAGLVRSMEQLGFIEGSSYFENGLETEVFDLTDTGAALPVVGDGRPVKPVVLYAIERYMRSSRTMQAGVTMTIADLVARVITTQTIPLSARMLLFTPRAVHEAVIEALTQRFDDRERLMNAEAGTVTILADLDPTRSGKSLDIW